MADGGASEMILMVAGLLVAGIVSGVLLSSFDVYSDSIHESHAGAKVDARTRIALVGDPMIMHWYPATTNMTVKVQNTGEVVLDISSAELMIGTTSMTTTSSSTDGIGSIWGSGSLATFEVSAATLTLNSGDEVMLTIFVQSDFYDGARGSTTITEVIRID